MENHSVTYVQGRCWVYKISVITSLNIIVCSRVPIADIFQTKKRKKRQVSVMHELAIDIPEPFVKFVMYLLYIQKTSMNKDILKPW